MKIHRIKIITTIFIVPSVCTSRPSQDNIDDLVNHLLESEEDTFDNTDRISDSLNCFNCRINQEDGIDTCGDFESQNPNITKQCSRNRKFCMTILYQLQNGEYSLNYNGRVDCAIPRGRYYM